MTYSTPPHAATVSARCCSSLQAIKVWHARTLSTRRPNRQQPLPLPWPQVMNPDHIEVSLEDVSGLEHIVDDLVGMLGMCISCVLAVWVQVCQASMRRTSAAWSTLIVGDLVGRWAILPTHCLPLPACPTPQETKVLYPMLRPELYCTTLWRQTKGVLLWVLLWGRGRGWRIGDCGDADCY